MDRSVENNKSDKKRDGSPLSSKSINKKQEVSALTIIYSIEREVSDLLQEISLRSQKNKLFSIQESLKMLTKRINSSNEATKDHPVINIERSVASEGKTIKSEFDSAYKAKVREGEVARKFYEMEITKLKEEINQLKQNNANETQNDERKKHILKMEQMMEENNTLNHLLNEEKNKTNTNILHLKNSEEALKTLSSEYDTLCNKYTKAQDLNEILERIICETKKTTTENKTKHDELIKINSQLKERLTQSETTLKLHMEDLKSVLKKNNHLQKLNEELESKIKQTTADLNYKEERLKALRHMNTKLEQKSNQILKKWEAFTEIDIKSNKMSRNNDKMLEVIEDMTQKLSFEENKNQESTKTIKLLQNELHRVVYENDEMKRQVNALKNINEEFSNKINELEGKYKTTFDSSRDKTNQSSISTYKERNLLSSNRNSKGNRNNNSNEIDIDDLHPAKIIIKNK